MLKEEKARTTAIEVERAGKKYSITVWPTIDTVHLSVPLTALRGLLEFVPSNERAHAQLCNRHEICLLLALLHQTQVLP